MPHKQEQTQEQQKNKFWNFIPGTATTPPELLLYGAISSYQSWWEDRVTPAKFNQELAELRDVKEIVVRINSGGGDVFAANAIFTRLKDHAARITVKIDGWAASAATIIAMAGDSIQIARNGVFMIHDPSMTVYDSFTAEEFEKMAEELRVIKNSIVNTYSMKTGKDAEEISQMMSDEKWWTGAEAVDNGFCDKLLFEDVETIVENQTKVVVNSVPMDLSAYKTSPNIQNMVITAPKNPGGFTNSAGSKKQSKEEQAMADKSITTIEALKAEYPDLVAQIENNAAAGERERIKAIKDTAPAGFEQIVEDAMFNNPITNAEMAVRILAEQKKQGSNFLANREADVQNGNVANVGAAAGEVGNETTDPFDAAIDNLDKLLK